MAKSTKSGVKRGKYYASINWTEDDNNVAMHTQLYSVGVYVALTIGNQTVGQESHTPMSLQSWQKKLLAQLKEKGIEPSLGREIVASDASGYWEEIE